MADPHTYLIFSPKLTYTCERTLVYRVTEIDIWVQLEKFSFKSMAKIALVLRWLATTKQERLREATATVKDLNGLYLGK